MLHYFITRKVGLQRGQQAQLLSVASVSLFSIAPCKTLLLVTKSISPLFRLLSVPEMQLVTNLSGLMPPQKAAYSVQKQDVSREAGGHGCSSGEAMVTTSFHWDLYTKMLCKLYETALRLQRGFLQRDWKRQQCWLCMSAGRQSAWKHQKLRNVFRICFTKTSTFWSPSFLSCFVKKIVVMLK